MLGALQNVLGNILKINKLVNQAVAYNERGQLTDMYHIFGEIFFITVDFEPVVLDDAGFGRNTKQDGEIFLQNVNLKDSSISSKVLNDDAIDT